MRDGGRRRVAVRIDAAEPLRLRVTLRQNGGRVGPRRKAKVAVGNDRIRLPIAGAARRGRVARHDRARRRSRRLGDRALPAARAGAAVSDLAVGDDGKQRCWWGASSPDYVAYHDAEWGRPITDDRGIYERLTLEAFQSGLSWLTILRKRENFREAFDGFEIERVAELRRARRRAAARRRGHRPQPGQDRGGDRQRPRGSASSPPAASRWRRSPGRFGLDPSAPRGPASSSPRPRAESKALAKELKAHGFRFVGPTTAYALMQAVGIVNDHLAGCVVRDEVEAERSRAVKALA